MRSIGRLELLLETACTGLFVRLDSDLRSPSGCRVADCSAGFSRELGSCDPGKVGRQVAPQSRQHDRIEIRANRCCGKSVVTALLPCILIAFAVTCCEGEAPGWRRQWTWQCRGGGSGPNSVRG